MRRPENLTLQQQQALIQMRHIHPEVEELMHLVEGFLQMLRTLQGQQLENWMQRVQQSSIREMQNFVEKLRQDRDAVQAGLTLKWSNGVVEGFDVLRQRVLYQSPSLSSGSFHEMCG